MCIAFRSDGGFCTPAGLVDSALKTLSPTLADVIGVLPDPNQDQALYSGNGEFLFVAKYSVQPEVVEKLTWPGMEKVAEFEIRDVIKFLSKGISGMFSDPIEDLVVALISPSGRYFIVKSRPALLPSSADDCILLDTLSGKITAMEWPFKILHSLDVHYFSDDESEINMLFEIYGHWEMVIYAGLSSNVFIKSRAELSGLHGPRLFRKGWTNNNHNTVLTITESGAVGRVKFSDKIEFLDEIEIVDYHSDEFVSTDHFVSQNSDRLACLQFRDDIPSWQLFDIANAGEKLRHLELDARSSSGTNSYTTSPDLSILVIGRKIYNVGFLDDQIASRPLKILIHLSKDCHGCVVSSCNSFIAFFSRYYPAQLEIFRLSENSNPCVQLQPSLPKNMTDFSVQFHPSRPLMIILYGLYQPRGDNRKRLLKRHCQSGDFHVAIIDLDTGNVRHVNFSANPQSLLIKRLVSIQIPKFHSIKSVTFRQSFSHKLEP